MSLPRLSLPVAMADARSCLPCMSPAAARSRGELEEASSFFAVAFIHVPSAEGMASYATALEAERARS